MSSDAWILAIAWFITSFIMLFAINRMENNVRRERDKMFDERVMWKDERKELMDRVMAPSFDHLKQAEVRLERVRQTKEPSKDNVLELL